MQAAKWRSVCEAAESKNAVRRSALRLEPRQFSPVRNLPAKRDDPRNADSVRIETRPLVARRSSPFGRLGQAHHCRGRVEADHSLLVVETCRRRRQQ